MFGTALEAFLTLYTLETRRTLHPPAPRRSRFFTDSLRFKMGVKCDRGRPADPRPALLAVT